MVEIPGQKIIARIMNDNPKKQLHVVAGVVEHEGYFLALQRGKGKYVYTDYKWEFPGGKIEDGEEPEAALVRELREELNYEVKVERHLGTVHHSYPDFEICLEFFLCHPEGDAEAFELKEHHSSAWLRGDELTDPDWAEADLEFVARLKEEFSAAEEEALPEEAGMDEIGEAPSRKELWMVLVMIVVLAIAYWVQRR